MSHRITLGALAACLAAALPIHLAEAQGVRSMQDYLKVAGDVAEVRLNCQREVDMQKLIALGTAHRVKTTDQASQDAAADMMVKAMNDANARRRQMGDAAYCARMISLYGPAGTVAAGLVK